MKEEEQRKRKGETCECLLERRSRGNPRKISKIIWVQIRTIKNNYNNCPTTLDTFAEFINYVIHGQHWRRPGSKLLANKNSLLDTIYTR